MAHLVFQALLLRSMKQIGGRNWKRKGRWWFWLQDSYLYQSSEDCKGCNGTSLPQSHLEVCSFWNCFVSFVFLNSVWIRNKHGKCRLTNAAFSHVDCLVRSEALCVYVKGDLVKSSVRHSKVDRQGPPCVPPHMYEVFVSFLFQKCHPCVVACTLVMSERTGHRSAWLHMRRCVISAHTTTTLSSKCHYLHLLYHLPSGARVVSVDKPANKWL